MRIYATLYDLLANSCLHAQVHFTLNTKREESLSWRRNGNYREAALHMQSTYLTTTTLLSPLVNHCRLLFYRNIISAVWFYGSRCLMIKWTYDVNSFHCNKNKKEYLRYIIHQHQYTIEKDKLMISKYIALSRRQPFFYFNSIHI